MSIADRGNPSHEALVCYWSNPGFVARRMAGHIAIKLHGPGYDGGGKQGTCFINWAPKPRSEPGGVHHRGTAGKRLDPLHLSSVGVHNKTRFTYSADKGAMEGSADEKLALPSRQATKRFGLDTDLIYDWWKVFSQATDTNWGMAFRNCSSVVAKAMLVGGAGAFASPPKASLWTPHRVYEWAVEVARKINEMNGKIGLNNRSNMLSGAVRPEGRMGPYPVDRFKTLTAGGALTPRAATLRAIDQGLRAFHDVPMSTDPDGLTKKIDAALDLFAPIHEHLSAHPPTGPSPVQDLGSQLLRFIEEAGMRIHEQHALRAEEASTSYREMFEDAEVMGPWNFKRFGRAPDHDVRIHNDANYALWAHWEEAGHSGGVGACMQCKVLAAVLRA